MGLGLEDSFFFDEREPSDFLGTLAFDTFRPAMRPRKPQTQKETSK